MKELLKRKDSIKSRIAALRQELLGYDKKREELLEAQADLLIVLDAITEAETKQRNDAARERAKHAPKKEWVPSR
jgi:hypothetical protein